MFRRLCRRGGGRVNRQRGRYVPSEDETVVGASPVRLLERFPDRPMVCGAACMHTLTAEAGSTAARQ